MKERIKAETMRPLSPSEIVHFHPERFAREKKLLDAIALPHTDSKFDASELADAMLAAAFVHAERAGEIAIAPAKASRLFGLRKIEVVEVGPGPKEGSFPVGTIEARLRGLVASGPRETERVVHDLLGDDSTYPDWSVVALVQQGLVGAGILESTTEKKLGFLKVGTLRVPDATRTLLATTNPGAVADEIVAWKRARPAEWELLARGIRKGIASRTEASDGPD